MPHDKFMERTRSVGWFTQESIDFQEKLLYRTGLGNDTYFPPGKNYTFLVYLNCLYFIENEE